MQDQRLATGQSRVSNLIEIIFALIKDRAAGETISSIAKSYGVQKGMISQLCKAAGVRNKLAPEDRISGVPIAIARPEPD